MTSFRAFTVLVLVASSLSHCVFSAPSSVVSPVVTTSSVNVNRERRSLVDLSSSSNTNANAYVNTFNGCQKASGGLGSLINGVLGTVGGVVDGVLGTVGGLVGSVVNDVVEPALTDVANLLDTALPTLENLVKCTDATLAGTVYQAFSAWASLQLKIFAAITVQAPKWSASTKAPVHAALVHLQVSLNSLLSALFNYISSDLDNLHLSASLRLGIQSAINACS